MRTPCRAPFLLTLLLLVLVTAAGPPPAAAQEAWQGAAAVGVTVTDKGGAPVRGARVVLRSTAVEPPAGPPALLTDAEGKVAVGGLREGEWLLEIRHPEHMAFTAYLELRPGKAPRSTFSAQMATSASWAPMRVALYKPRTMAGLPAPDLVAATPPAPSPPPAAPAPAPPASTEPAVEPAPAPPAEPPSAAVLEVAPPAAPRPDAPQPAPTPPVPSPPVAPPPVAPEPTPPRAATPVAPAPPRSVEGPAAPPSPPSPRPAGDLAFPASPTAGCPECRSGEFALPATTVAAGGGSTCPAGLVEEIRAALTAAAAGAAANAAPAAGTLADVLARLAAAGGSPAASVPGAGQDACQILAVVLPREVKYVGYRYDVRDEQGAADCVPGTDCAIGAARWLDHAALLRAPAVQIVYGVFENRHPQRARAARLTAYYRARPAWAPAPPPG